MFWVEIVKQMGQLFLVSRGTNHPTNTKKGIKPRVAFYTTTLTTAREYSVSTQMTRTHKTQNTNKYLLIDFKFHTLIDLPKEQLRQALLI